MRALFFLTGLLIVCGCSTSHNLYYWRVREMAFIPAPTIGLEDRNQKVLLTVNTPTMQRLMLAHIRITRSAGVQADLYVVDGDDPNAFADILNGRPVIAINLAMVKLIGDDMDEFAALLGHEAGHFAKGHIDSGKTRSTTLQGIGTLIGSGLGMAGVPAAGYIAGLGTNLIEASYSRDDEREADAVGIDYMLANGFDPQGSIRLHEKMLQLPAGFRIPFLGSHPSGEERIENLKKLIAEKNSAGTP